MKVWPAPGRRVRDPATGLILTRRGLDVPDTGYWRRRQADGDVSLDSGRAQKAAPSRPDAAKPLRTPKPPKPATPRSSSAKRDSATNPESTAQ